MRAPDPEQIPIGRSIGRTHKFVHALGDRALAPLGATVTDYILLSHIDAAEAPGLSQTEIARFSHMGGPALVRHLDRLEREGTVERTRDASDRRITRVTLTDAGRAHLADLVEVIEQVDARLRHVITPEEADVLQRALQKLFEFALRESHDPAPPAALAPPPTTDPHPRSRR